MNGGQRAEPSGTEPDGEVEAAGEKLWEPHSAGSMLSSRSDAGKWFKWRRVQVNVRVHGVLIRPHRKMV